MRPVDEQMAILMQGVEFGDPQLYQVMQAELRERLSEGRPLRVYCGYDPTAPDIHLGHTVTMRKLRQFQDLGHEVTFLIGTFTGLIGDPSDKEALRPQRTPEELMANARTYAEQAFKILDRDKTIIRYNADWLSQLTFADAVRLASHFTVQQFLARDNFAKRMAKGDPIWLHEFFYALMQGYDAVVLQTDVQIGATEQLFNLMAGRKLQEAFGQRPQVCLTLPILVGTDGRMRMSKSAGNYIGINEPPEEQYGKVMSIPDEVMMQYYRLVTRFSPEQIAQIETDLQSGRLHPRDAKMMLAREIVSIFHGDEAAARAEEHFKTVFQQRELPPEMGEYSLRIPLSIVDLICAAGLAPSKREARRLIEQGGVKLEGHPVQSVDLVVQPGPPRVLQVGRRRFVRVV
ncbi:MAG: tyrosine--tRNA ligase [Ardenticatenia bacterium]|jgi:tyrosyl-tRNA synthetase|nr:MAG: tyrosine--tRNA ligase [Ardenticatenia bacterium]